MKNEMYTFDDFSADEINNWISGEDNPKLDSIIYRYLKFGSQRKIDESFIGFRHREHCEFKPISLSKLSKALNEYVRTDMVTTDLKRSIVSNLEQEAVKRYQKEVFDTYYSMFEKARELEKQDKPDEALNLYLHILSSFTPEGTLYYERPMILLEKQQRFSEAIEICERAIKEIKAKTFNADVKPFETRLSRLMKKAGR